MLNRLLFPLGALLAVAVPIVSIVQKEVILRRSRPVLLELAPVDPRSLMQGDYMVLAYQVARGFRWESRDGHLVLKDDARGVADFVRVHEGQPLGPGEYLLRFRDRGRGTRLGAESFFFQEGKAQHYQRAKYGELRVTTSGDAVLVGLRDQDLRELGKAF